MATTTKTIKKTTYLVSNIVSFIILESIVQTYYYLKNDNNDNALNNLISTCSNDILIISLMFYIGLNCITMMKHHMIATKIFNMSMILINLSIVLEVGFYYSTGQKIHAEIFSFMMEQIFHHKNNLATDGNMLLNVTNLLTHLNHFAFVPIIFAILFVLGLKHLICKVCTTFIILNDNKYVKSNVGYKKMNYVKICLLSCIVFGNWSYNKCTNLNGVTRLSCESFNANRFLHLNDHLFHKHLKHVQYDQIKNQPKQNQRSLASTNNNNKATSSPNIVLIGLESIRATATSLYPSNIKGKKTTPFLDHLVENDDAIIVEHAYASIAQTAKQLISIYCGLEPNIKMTWSEWREYDLENNCLPNVLRKQFGYKTAVFTSGKTDNGLAKKPFTTANALGFEDAFGFQDIKKSKTLTNKFEQVSYLGYEEKAILQPLNKYLIKETNNIVMKQNNITKRNALMLGIFTVSSHTPYKTPANFRTKKHLSLNNDENNYLNTVRYVDSFLSQLFITLNDNGINKTNTIFIITGDHGQTFGKNNQYYHGALHEDSTWVPLILYGDLIKKKNF